MTASSRIFDAVLQTASDLKAGGFISEQRLAEYQALCEQPVPAYSADQIRRLRERYRISPAALAVMLNTSPATVRKWEAGQNHPSGPSLKLLNLLDRKGLEALL